MKLDKNKKILLIIILALVVVLVIFLVIYKNVKPKQEEPENVVSTNTNIQNKSDEEMIKKLKKVDEAERIRIYLGTYFKYIEKKDYQSAYNLLYPEFKATYFPKLEDFKKYLQDEKYPNMLSIEYNDISLKGSYYVVEISIKDFLKEQKRYSKSGKFIVQENDYNDYFISFQK
ncbi:MAG: hypothetical protein IJH39_02115 [Clostridia bacterium]|nr:hypothetical protein [Clostridia bacterium]